LKNEDEDDDDEDDDEEGKWGVIGLDIVLLWFWVKLLDESNKRDGERTDFLIMDK
jgi:hypothetical protein